MNTRVPAEGAFGRRTFSSHGSGEGLEPPACPLGQATLLGLALFNHRVADDSLRSGQRPATVTIR
jgi:hypothetical protein